VEVAIWAADQSAASAPNLLRDSRVRKLTGDIVRSISEFGKPDLVHDNGIWRPFNHTIARVTHRLRIPRIVSARGMLEPWAMDHKRLKKRCAWWAYQRRDIAKASLIHATAEQEAENIQRLGVVVPIVIIPNGIDIPDALTRPLRGERAEKTALFLGRLSPKKGLVMLLRAWQQTDHRGWRLIIAGPDEDGYQATIEKLVRELGLQDKVSLIGPVYGDQKKSAFENADLFILPTLSENFGIVVAEALANAVPVITTDAAPWPMLETKGCGWTKSASQQGIQEALGDALKRDRDTLRAMGERGRKFVQSEFAWQAISTEFLHAYEKAVSST
jgi:glycosyltransferase involved in cell wall biosynthesis